MEELRNAATVKSLSKRSNVDLCVHGINKSYCQPCATKKAAKSTRAKKVAPAPAGDVQQ